MQRVIIGVIAVVVVVIVAGMIVLANMDFPAPSSHVEKVLPDRFPK